MAHPLRFHVAAVAAFALSCRAGAVDAPAATGDLPADTASEALAELVVLANELRPGLAAPELASLGLLGQLMFLPPLVVQPSAAGRCGGAGLAVGAAPRDQSIALPDSLKRRVYTLDAFSNRYRWSGDTTGPPDGVRFDLARLDTFGAVRRPFEPVGRLELFAGSGPGLIEGRLLGTGPAVVRYTVALGAQSASAMTTGRITRPRLLLTLRDTVNDSAAARRISAAVSAPLHGLRVRLVATRTVFDAADYRYEFEATFRDGTDSLRLTGRTDQYCFFVTTDVQAFLNGADFAGLAGALGVWAARGADGTPLDVTRTGQLLRLLDSQRLLFDALSALHEPIAQLARLSP